MIFHPRVQGSKVGLAHDLQASVGNVIRGQFVPGCQKAAVGCKIFWRCQLESGEGSERGTHLLSVWTLRVLQHVRKRTCYLRHREQVFDRASKCVRILAEIALSTERLAVPHEIAVTENRGAVAAVSLAFTILD